MTQKVKNIVLQLCKAFFAIGLIVWLMQSGKLDFKGLLPLLNPSAIMSGLACSGFALALATERWRRFMIAQKIPIGFWVSFKLTLIGTFFNFAMPGGVGGDLVKGYYITRTSPNARMSAVITVLLDRLIGLFAMLLMALIAMLLRWDLIQSKPALQSIFWLLTLLFIGFCLGWIIIFSRRIYQTQWTHRLFAFLPTRLKILHLYEAFAEYRHHKMTFVSTFFLSISSQVTSVFFFVFVGQALGFQDIPLFIYFFVVPIGFMIQALPLSPAGIGVGQTALLFLFHATLTKGFEVGPLAMTAYQISLFAYGLLGALFYLGISHKIKKT